MTSQVLQQRLFHTLSSNPSARHPSLAHHQGRLALNRICSKALALAEPQLEERLSCGIREQLPTPPFGSQDTDRTAANFCVVNFYHLVDLAQPHAVIRQHRDWLRDRDVLGRIYVTYQGINAQLSGPEEDAHAYAEWVSQQADFRGLSWSSDPTDGHQFPRLRLKYRENLVQLAGGTGTLPITDAQARATPLSPSEWQAMLPCAARRSAASEHASVPMPILLDVRNGYEWDAGHFTGAERPLEEHFNQTPTSVLPSQLAAADRDAPVMMYCTGGIRCDIYSAHLAARGFSNLYTLRGGVAGYLRDIGGAGWRGSLFTFDDRLAVAPEGRSLRRANLTAAAPCRTCGSTASLPHLNCANIDCNRLFIACASCQARLEGCCCAACTSGPRFVRPAQSGGCYGAWHSLRSGSGGEAERLDAMRRGRGGGRSARRQRRLERLKEKHAAHRLEKAHRREAVKEAMRAAKEGRD